MTVLHAAEDASDHAEPLTVDAAYARCHRLALRESDIGAVGLEMETHLVNLDEVAARVPWHRVDPMPESVRQAAGRSAITLEPGAQLELSGPPAPNTGTPRRARPRLRARIRSDWRIQRLRLRDKRAERGNPHGVLGWRIRLLAVWSGKMTFARKLCENVLDFKRDMSIRTTPRFSR